MKKNNKRKFRLFENSYSKRLRPLETFVKNALKSSKEREEERILNKLKNLN